MKCGFAPAAWRQLSCCGSALSRISLGLLYPVLPGQVPQLLQIWRSGSPMEFSPYDQCFPVTHHKPARLKNHPQDHCDSTQGVVGQESMGSPRICESPQVTPETSPLLLALHQPGLQSLRFSALLVIQREQACRKNRVPSPGQSLLGPFFNTGQV